MTTKLRIDDIGYMEFDGVDMRDYPDFCDAFACYAEYKDGTPLTEEELDELNWYHHEYVCEVLFDKL